MLAATDDLQADVLARPPSDWMNNALGSSISAGGCSEVKLLKSTQPLWSGRQPPDGEA